VRAALLEREGEYGAMLRVAEELETEECDRGKRVLAKALGKLGLSVKQVREIELAAFGWVRELSGAEVH
jgi:EAL and modified HD-GYP domain-containing signal transduction protein